MSWRVAKWLKNVRFATSARSQISSIVVDGHALIQEQVESRTENPVAHLLLAPIHPVHGCNHTNECR